MNITEGRGLVWKIAASLLITAAVPIIALPTVLYGDFTLYLSQQAERSVARAVDRTTRAFNHQGRHLLSITRDYSHWDEFNKRMLAGDRSWIEENVSEWLPKQFGYPVTIVTGMDGKVFVSHGATQNTLDQIIHSPFFAEALVGEESFRVLRTSDGLFLVSASRVTPSFLNDEDPKMALASGVLVAAIPIDSDLAADIEETTGVDTSVIDLERAGEAVMVDLNSIRSGRMTWQDNGMLRIINQPIIGADGETLGVFRLEQSLEATAQFRRRLLRSVLASVAASILASGLLAAFLATRLSRPLGLMTKAVRDFSIGKKPALSRVEKADELGELQNAFAKLLDDLSASKRIISSRETDLERMNADLDETKRQLERKLKELEEFNGAMVGRELKMVELKQEIERLKKLNSKPSGGKL